MQFAQLKRREFITLLGGAAAACPLAARAQSQKTLRIGMVSVLPRNNPPVDAFLKRLREFGYDEGQNLAFEYLKVPSAAEYPQGVTEVVGRHVDIIIAHMADVTRLRKLVRKGNGVQDFQRAGLNARGTGVVGRPVILIDNPAGNAMPIKLSRHEQAHWTCAHH